MFAIRELPGRFAADGVLHSVNAPALSPTSGSTILLLITKVIYTNCPSVIFFIKYASKIFKLYPYKKSKNITGFITINTKYLLFLFSKLYETILTFYIINIIGNFCYKSPASQYLVFWRSCRFKLQYNSSFSINQ